MFSSCYVQVVSSLQCEFRKTIKSNILQEPFRDQYEITIMPLLEHTYPIEVSPWSDKLL